MSQSDVNSLYTPSYSVLSHNLFFNIRLPLILNRFYPPIRNPNSIITHNHSPHGSTPLSQHASAALDDTRTTHLLRYLDTTTGATSSLSEGWNCTWIRQSGTHLQAIYYLCDPKQRQQGNAWKLASLLPRYRNKKPTDQVDRHRDSWR